MKARLEAARSGDSASPIMMMLTRTPTASMARTAKGWRSCRKTCIKVGRLIIAALWSRLAYASSASFVRWLLNGYRSCFKRFLLIRTAFVSGHDRCVAIAGRLSRIFVKDHFLGYFLGFRIVNRVFIGRELFRRDHVFSFNIKGLR